jgi:hypothetical protein
VFDRCRFGVYFLAQVPVEGDVFAGRGLVGCRYRCDEIDGVVSLFRH